MTNGYNATYRPTDRPLYVPVEIGTIMGCKVYAEIPNRAPDEVDRKSEMVKKFFTDFLEAKRDFELNQEALNSHPNGGTE